MGGELNNNNNNNKDTSKHQKMDEKGTHFEMNVYPSIFGHKKFAHYTQTHSKNSMGWVILLYSQC